MSFILTVPCGNVMKAKSDAICNAHAAKSYVRWNSDDYATKQAANTSMPSIMETYVQL
jgi:hypothetical protein